MKHLKKIASLLLAMVMVLTMCVTGYAANKTAHTITVKNAEDNHEYVAYQVFKGDKSGSTLINIEWNTDDVRGDDILNELKTKPAYASCKSAEDVAKVLEKETEFDSDRTKEFAEIVSKYLKGNGSKSVKNASQDSDGKYSYTIDVTGDGYYFIKDTKKPEGQNVNTRFILKVVDKEVTVTPKTSVPTLNKQIKHNEHDTWGVVGDNQIGDTVEFRTITTVPDTSNYGSYIYKIHDTMSSQLTSMVKGKDDISIKVNNTDKLDPSYYEVTVDSDNPNKFTVTVDILRAIRDGKMQKDKTLYTYYSGILNENAIIYDKGKQDNTAYLEYSNNPGVTTDTGNTPEKKVYDWTFKMQVQKIDGTSKKQIDGAKFVLSKKAKNEVAYGTVDNDGKPSNTANLIEFIKTTSNGKTVYTVKPENYANSNNNELTYVIEAGDIVINGLDDAVDYYLYETKAPEGYHILTDPVRFKINASYEANGAAYTSVNVKIDNEDESSNLIATVENKSGSTLPETGGIGTTIFYVVGVILMLGAGVLLVTKKRMSSNR